MNNAGFIVVLIFALIISGLLMVFTNGSSDDKAFGSRKTDKDYPFFVYLFIFVLVFTAYFIIFKLDLNTDDKPDKGYVVPFMQKQ